MSIDTETKRVNPPSEMISPRQNGVSLQAQQPFQQPVPSAPVMQVAPTQPMVQPVDNYHLPSYPMNNSSHNVMFNEVPC